MPNFKIVFKVFASTDKVELFLFRYQILHSSYIFSFAILIFKHLSTHAKESFPIILFLWYMAKADMRKFNVEKKSGAKKVRQ